MFTTVERADLTASLLYQQVPGHVEPFQRDILYISVYDSLRHRKTAINDASALTATILGKLQAHITTATLKRPDVINVTTEVLKRFDKPAASTYTAYHPL